MKYLSFILFCLLVSSLGYATQQVPDIFIYNGKKYHIAADVFLLENYYKKNPEKRPWTVIHSTACYRRYIATFEINNKQIYLHDITVEDTVQSRLYPSITKSVLGATFPGDKKFKIEDYTGLIFGTSEEVQVDSSCDTWKHESYLLLQVFNGRIVREMALNDEEYEIFRHRQFEAFKKTKAYEEHFNEMWKMSYFPMPDIDAFIDCYLFYSGEIDKIFD